MDTINTLSVCMQGIISAGLLMRIIFCAVRLTHEEEESGRYRRRIKNTLVMLVIGSRELRQFLIGGAASAVLGALLLIFSGQLLALIVCIMIGASGSIMAVRKDPYTRISVVTQIGNMIKFRRTQQNFRYVYKSP